MKNPPPARAVGVANSDTVRAASQVPFRIFALRRVAHGSKVAEFSLETPLGVIDADLFTPSEREPFVQGRSVRDKFTGEWRRSVRFSPNFTDDVCTAVLSLLKGGTLDSHDKDLGD